MKSNTRKVMYCSFCEFIGSLRAAPAITMCYCGNMAAQFENALRVSVDVLALKKDHAWIIDINELFRKRLAKRSAVGRQEGVRWAPVRQKQIDNGLKLVSDFVRKRKRKRGRIPNHQSEAV